MKKQVLTPTAACAFAKVGIFIIFLSRADHGISSAKVWNTTFSF